MQLKKIIRIILVGIGVETVGIILDIMHHLQIGIKTPEGLLTFNHTLIFAGFLVNLIAVLVACKSQGKY